MKPRERGEGDSLIRPTGGCAARQGMVYFFVLFVLNRAYNLMQVCPARSESVLNSIWFQLWFLSPRQGPKIAGVVLHRVGIFVSFLS